MTSLVRGISRWMNFQRIIQSTTASRAWFSTLDNTNNRNCWKCHIQHTDSLFCPSCKSIQEPLSLSHFEILRLAPQFSFDMSSVKPYYIKLQSILHPDNFATATEQEQEYSSVHSTAVNEAYNTLSDPLKRGLYLLEINGHALESETVDSTEEGLLNDIFTLSFEVEEAEDEEELRELLTDMEERVVEERGQANEAFDAGDFANAKRCMVKLKYYGNIERTIKDKIFALTL